MAGGLGTRLRPLTNSCPKPLLKIGNKPILEIIVENFIQEGFRNFFISVNYKAEMIEDYLEMALSGELAFSICMKINASVRLAL